jgi:hypothetical protein
MDAFYGYNGGETTRELAEFISKSLDSDEGDAVDKIKTVYFPIGHVMEIARQKKEVQEMGIQVWCSTIKNSRTGKSFSYTTINNCYRAWQKRDKFEAALAWYQNPGRNSHWAPAKPNGPLFAIDLVAAYEGKDKPAKAKAKKETSAKVLVRRFKLLQEHFDKVAAEHRKFAAELDREPFALQAAEHALAQEFGEDGEAPVKPGFHVDTATDAANSDTMENTETGEADQAPVTEDMLPPSFTKPKGSKSKRQRREEAAAAGAESVGAENVAEAHAQPAEPAGAGSGPQPGMTPHDIAAAWTVWPGREVSRWNVWVDGVNDPAAWVSFDGKEIGDIHPENGLDVTWNRKPYQRTGSLAELFDCLTEIESDMMSEAV